MIGPKVVASANRRLRRIELLHTYNGHVDLTMWAPHKRAQIRKVHLGRLLRELGLDPKEMVGKEYKGFVRHGVVVLCF